MALLVLAPSASATTRLLKSSFGTFAGRSPRELAVDQSNGDVYAINFNNASLDRFTAAGAPDNYTAGPGAGTNQLPVPFNSGEVDQSGVAVDNSGGPADGTVYVADGEGKIEAFESDGAPLTTLTGTGTADGAFGFACGVAVDQSDGDLYVADLVNSRVYRYSPAGSTVAEADYSGAITTPTADCGVAADAGKVYAADTYEARTTVDRFNATDFALGAPPSPSPTVIDTRHPTALATDPSTGDLYVDEGDQVQVFDSTGAPTYAFGEGDFVSPGDETTWSAGVAVKAGGKAYVSDRVNHRVNVYSPFGGVTSTPPGLSTEAATGIGLDIATLNGSVNPHSNTLNNCRFEYIDDASYQENVANFVDTFTGAQTSACDTVPAGKAAVEVHAAVTGLSEDTTYHVRVVVSTAKRTFTGSPVTFATDPLAFTDGANSIHHLEATLNGHIDPQGAAGFEVTECHFDWGTTTAYAGGTVPCVPAASGGSPLGAPTSVSAALPGLHPGSTYHFRLHVTTASHGDALGADQSFIATPYALEAKEASAIDPTHATLNGHLDPEGQPALDVTECHFDWGTDTTYSGGTLPCSQGNSFESAADVSARLAGLSQNATYHFRLHITTAAAGEFTSADETLTTAIFPVVTDAASDLHHTDVVLNGHFDPLGDPDVYVTNCQFDWGTDTSYSGGVLPCDQGDSFNAPASVSASLKDLEPAATYHFRLHVTTADASEFTGADQTVTPPAFPVGAPLISTFGQGSGASSNIDQLEFDQANRRIYGVNPSGVYGFDASAPPAYPPLAGFSPLVPAHNLNSHPGLAVGNGGNLFVISEGSFASPPNPDFPFYVYGYDVGGTPLGGNFPLDPSVNPGPITQNEEGAVDSLGNLWVGRNDGHVLKYSASGAYQSSLDVSAHSRAIRDLAFDSADDLYVANGQGVWRYSATSGYTAETQIALLPDVRAIAVDQSNGDLFVARSNSINVYDGSGTFLGVFTTSVPFDAIEGIAIDKTNHYVYVAGQTPENQRYVIYAFGAPGLQKPPTVTGQPSTAIAGTTATLHAKVDPESIQVTDCHFETVPNSQFQASGFTSVTAGQKHICSPDMTGPAGSGSGDVAVHADVSGLDGGTTYHSRIVASNAEAGGTASGADQEFTTRGPQIADTKASAVSDTAATLNAKVNPEGADTTFQFQYTTDADFQVNGFANAQAVPADPSEIGSGGVGVAVSEDVDSLDPATTYRFRVVAENVDATVPGPAVAFTTFTTPPDFSGDNCPNDQLRTGAGARLPDCRAYEQASLVDKNGASAVSSPHFDAVAPNGDAVSYADLSGLPAAGGNPNTFPVVAHRTPMGWTTTNVSPILPAGTGAQLVAVDPSLSRSFTSAGGHFYVGDLTKSTWSSPFSAVTTEDFLFSVPAFSDDPDHFLLSSSSALAPGALREVSNLYDYDDGKLKLADRIPVLPATSCNDEVGPVCVVPSNGAYAGSTNVEGSDVINSSNSLTFNTISGDGSKIVFSAFGMGRLYLREDGTRTIEVSASQASTPDPNGHKPALWRASSHDGRTIYFTSCERLTDDSTAVSTAGNTCATTSQGADLYVYHVDTGNLTDLTVDSNADPRGADVQKVVAASPDGAYVYFTANGRLAPGASSGNCERGSEAGACELYLSHDGGAPVDIARMSGKDLTRLTAEVSPATIADDGTLVFRSNRQLTSYDNIGPCSNAGGAVIELISAPCNELYRYQPGDAGVTCISCDPTGEPPIGNMNNEVTNPSASFVQVLDQSAPVSLRALSDDGNRVFFQTPDSLVAGDRNAAAGCSEGRFRLTAQFTGNYHCQDVYEWEADGTGSCRSAGENDGCLYLISSGTSEDPAWFVAASASGNDVFFGTTAQLVPQDTDDLYDVYDARVDGGLASQHQASPPPCGSADQCRGPGSTVPSNPGAGSGVVEGPGNAPPPACRGGKVSRGGHCVTKHHKKKHRHKTKKQHHGHSHKRAGSDRGGSK